MTIRGVHHTGARKPAFNDSVANQAIAWAQAQLAAGHSYSEVCLGFCSAAYRAAGHPIPELMKNAARDALAAFRAEGKLQPMGNTPPPKGALVFWPPNRANGGYGHITISNGDGTVVTSGWPGFPGGAHVAISWLNSQEGGSKPAGWAMPDGVAPGTGASTPQADWNAGGAEPAHHAGGASRVVPAASSGAAPHASPGDGYAAPAHPASWSPALDDDDDDDDDSGDDLPLPRADRQQLLRRLASVGIDEQALKAIAKQQHVPFKVLLIALVHAEHPPAGASPAQPGLAGALASGDALAVNQAIESLASRLQELHAASHGQQSWDQTLDALDGAAPDVGAPTPS